MPPCWASDDEEVLVMVPLTAQSLTGSKVAFLAGSEASSRRALKLNPADGPVLIDLTGALEEQPHARLRAPSAEPTRSLPEPGLIPVIAHPAAIACAMLLAGLAKIGNVRRSIIHVFEPASERGKKGLDELRQQTVGVLVVPETEDGCVRRAVGVQPAGALRRRSGGAARGCRRAHPAPSGIAAGAVPAIPMPSLRLIQAPVFHGHSFSVWVEFEENPGAAALAEGLAAAGFDVRSDDPPTNVSIAGMSGLSVGAIAVDPNQARACWMWMVSDNLRLSAENALAVAKGFLR